MHGIAPLLSWLIKTRSRQVSAAGGGWKDDAGNDAEGQEGEGGQHLALAAREGRGAEGKGSNCVRLPPEEVVREAGAAVLQAAARRRQVRPGGDAQCPNCCFCNSCCRTVPVIDWTPPLALVLGRWTPSLALVRAASGGSETRGEGSG